jgi:hypothetical protein
MFNLMKRNFQRLFVILYHIFIVIQLVIIFVVNNVLNMVLFILMTNSTLGKLTDGHMEVFFAQVDSLAIKRLFMNVWLDI